MSTYNSFDLEKEFNSELKKNKIEIKRTFKVFILRVKNIVDKLLKTEYSSQIDEKITTIKKNVSLLIEKYANLLNQDSDVSKKSDT
jgi:hypothetical protein